MKTWNIKVLCYGTITGPKSGITPNYDTDVILESPYLGFLIHDDNRKILVDTGISDDYIIDGKAWGGFPAKGGRAYLEKALAEANLDPLDIDTILFTHLHNDHAANTSIFKNARLIFQQDEWLNLLDPTPLEKYRRDYDPKVIDEIKQMNCLKIDGDLVLTAGITLYKTPGHTRGGMSIAVNTKKGIRIIVGDHWHLHCLGFTKMQKIMDMHGKWHKITPPPPEYGGFFPSSLTSDYHAYYASCYKIKALIPEDKPEYILPGHEGSLLVNGV